MAVMPQRLVVLTLSAAAALCAPQALAASSTDVHDHVHHEPSRLREFGEPGDVTAKSRIVEITMRESNGKMFYEPREIQVSVGEQILFRIVNAGALPHEIVLGTVQSNQAHADEMKSTIYQSHDDINAKTLKPGAAGNLLWRFSKPGRFEYACLIPGHYEAGMVGYVTVTPKK